MANNSSGADPYEQQLLAMFESCCSHSETGAPPGLDAKGLSRLCEKLQLEEQAPRLLERLLSARQQEHVTFPQFRDALLSLLGAHVEEIDGSPEREVRPKFVFGKKKYGRRSRPEQSGSSDESDSEGDTPPEHTPSPTGGDLTPRKRKWAPSAAPVSDHGVWGKSLSEEEESVRATWERLGAAHEGYLGRDELRLVCKATGLEGAADELVQRLFERLGVEADGRVSFEQFLRLFRSGLAEDTALTSPRARPTSQQHEQPQQRSLTFDATDEETNGKLLGLPLDVYTSGLVSPEQLLTLWEAGGVPDAARLLHDLGLGSPPARRPISLAELSTALEEEARALAEESGQPEQPLTCVLHASLVTQQAETKCLKAALEQVLGERDKLRQDVAEANERASLLAQEVDDRHARLEQASQQQARLQEQRHGDEVRALQGQLSMEREQLAALTTGLELRLGQMQAEEAKLRAELAAITRRCDTLDKDNVGLREKLAESEQDRSHLQWKVDTMPQLELRLAELESEQAEMHSRTVLPLQEKLESFTAENTALRDANDELTLKLEEISRNSGKRPTEDVEPVRGIGRRRGRPGGPSSDESSDEDSPRLGKQRRRASTEGDSETERLRERVAELERQLTLCHQQVTTDSEMREDHTTERNGNSMSQATQVDIEVQENHETEIEVLRRRCEELSQLQQMTNLRHESSDLMLLRTSPGTRNPAADWLPVQSMEGEGAVGGSADEESLDQVKAEIERLLSAKVAFHRENSALRETINELSNGKPISEKGEIQVLRDRVVELEASLEQMREEYEHCEDYWQGKLDDERKLYEQEQAATDERFSELELKIREYEDLLCQEQGGASGGTSNGRLSPIAESLVLEKQVTDLEDECTALQQQLNSLTMEYEAVQRKLAEICSPQCLVQTEPRPRSVSLLSGYSLRDKHTQVTPANL
ncbi:hypothetical protein B566_EDAN016936, partial [Ephemera danica]